VNITQQSQHSLNYISCIKVCHFVVIMWRRRQDRACGNDFKMILFNSRSGLGNFSEGTFLPFQLVLLWS